MFPLIENPSGAHPGKPGAQSRRAGRMIRFLVFILRGF
ncbi:MAG: hypothetical protein LBI96_04805 [Odoribacteraceae bacterium]|nr:hypothetical protein [Odoribacteraceae bacterium]